MDLSQAQEIFGDKEGIARGYVTKKSINIARQWAERFLDDECDFRELPSDLAEGATKAELRSTYALAEWYIEKGREAEAQPCAVASFDQSESATFGAILGDRLWRGLILREASCGFRFLLCLAYEDRGLAKGVGAKFTKQAGWHIDFAAIEEAAGFAKQVLESDDLVEALGYKRIVPLYVAPEVANFRRAWTAAVAGLSPLTPVTPTGPVVEQGGDVTITQEEAQSISEESGFIGLAMTEKGPRGFVIDTGGYYPGTNDSIKKLAKYAGGKAKWLPVKKLWLIPLKAAELICSKKPYEQEVVADVFEVFPMTEGAQAWMSEHFPLAAEEK